MANTKAGGKKPAAKKQPTKKPASGNTAAAKKAPAKKPAASRAQTAQKAPSAGRAKTSTAKRGAPVKEKRLSNEIKGITLIALGCFIGLALLTDATGLVGQFIKTVCYGLFGNAAAILFVVVILTGLNVFVDKSSLRNAYKAWLVCGIMLSSAVMVSLFMRDTAFVQGGFVENVKTMFSYGVDGYGGGVLGGGLCKVFAKLIGVSGTWILSISAALVLLILLTGISIEALVRRIGSSIKAQSQTLAERARETVEFEDAPEREELPEAAEAPKKKRKLVRRKKPSAAEPKPDGQASEDGYFDDYFSGAEPETSRRKKPADDEDSLKNRSSEVLTDEPRRFAFQADDDLLDKLLPKENADVMPDDLPFELDNMKTGVLTQLPDADGNIPKEPDPDGLDFEPPSEAKIEDRLDPMTKKAIEAGVPLDEAVTTARKMAVEGVETLDEKIESQITEHAAPRIIQYRLPSLDLLEKPKPNTKTRAEIKYELEEKANRLLDTLLSFKVEASIMNITQGPTVTRFELQPGFGVKVSKITGLSDDIALSLAAPGVRIEAPIPGKSAIGIEIPNAHPSPVPIREVLDTEKFKNFKSKTAFALGKDIGGNCIVADIASFPHVLIAGATGSGKSVCINSLITSILYKAKPDEVKMIMVDPKMVELGIYNGIPHLLIPVVTDPKHAAAALNWAVTEMKNRYNLLRDNKVRNLKGYNKLMEENDEPEAKLPEIVIIIDELADLMMAAKNEVEDAINSLAALARAAGMYLVIATQRPSVNVITGVIKANVPSRISFAVASQVDSRTIIDSPGAEKLLGKGDMLYNPKGEIKPVRIQGNFVSDDEIERVIEFIKSQYEAEYDEEIIETIEKEHERVAADTDMEAQESGMTRSGGSNKDELFLDAVEMVLESGQASVAMFQRKFKIGYQRAARLIDQMEESRIIGPYEGTKPRQVLINRQEFNEMKINMGA